MVNFIPALKYLPNWLPGMKWKRVINEWRAQKEYTTSAPYKWTKEQMASPERRIWLNHGTDF